MRLYDVDHLAQPALRVLCLTLARLRFRWMWMCRQAGGPPLHLVAHLRHLPLQVVLGTDIVMKVPRSMSINDQLTDKFCLGQRVLHYDTMHTYYLYSLLYSSHISHYFKLLTRVV